MADGVPITAGSGTTVATDDCGGGGHAQIFKLAISANGDATLVPADAANGIDVDVTRMPAVNLAAATSGGWTPSKTISAASTNATSVKASAGQVGGWYLSNVNAAARFLKLYNKASAPTVGTDTPVMTILIPAGAAANVEFTQGIAFATGIAFALTTGVADSDTGAVAASEIVVNLLYK